MDERCLDSPGFPGIDPVSAPVDRRAVSTVINDLRHRHIALGASAEIMVGDRLIRAAAVYPDIRRTQFGGL
jgi:hypothetical protein